jgi:OOP family OmpA-OmpF porin
VTIGRAVYEEMTFMRRFLGPVFSMFLTFGFGAATIGCAAEPPPKPRAPRVRKSPKPAPTNFEFVGGALKLPGAVVFETGSDRLNPVSDEVLEVVLDYLVAKPDVTLLRIEGHTDSDGSAASNQALSEKRAMSVARWLTAAGVSCSRLIPVGFGQTKPVVPNDTADNKAQNRRVAFVNAAINGKMIGGASPNAGGQLAGDACR